MLTTRTTIDWSTPAEGRPAGSASKYEVLVSVAYLDEAVPPRRFREVSVATQSYLTKLVCLGRVEPSPIISGAGSKSGPEMIAQRCRSTKSDLHCDFVHG